MKAKQQVETATGLRLRVRKWALSQRGRQPGGQGGMGRENCLRESPPRARQSDKRHFLAIELCCDGKMYSSTLM